MRSFAFALAVAALALLPVAGRGAPAHPAPHNSALEAKIKAQQAKLHNVHAKLHQKQQELDAARSAVGNLGEQLAATNRNIASVQAHLGQIDAGIASTQRKLAWNKIQLAAAQATLQRHNDALKRRLIAAYEYGDLGYLAVLLEAKSFDDFIQRWNDVRYVIKANETTIRERRADADRVARVQSGLLADEASLRSAEADANQQRNALDGLAAERRNLLAVAENAKQQVASQVSQLNDVSEATEAALESLIREKQLEEDARRDSARRAAQLAGETLPEEPGAPGTLLWPVSGPITSPFGMRMHPVYGRPILHAGIDIGVPMGTTVAAAAEGHVIVASYQGDCGNMIAIDHHGGLVTLYCHLSQMFVGVGQDVQRGQAIGAAGMTGDATGPHVHFQVMQNGHPVDPMTFLR